MTTAQPDPAATLIECAMHMLAEELWRDVTEARSRLDHAIRTVDFAIRAIERGYNGPFSTHANIIEEQVSIVLQVMTTTEE